MEAFTGQPELLRLVDVDQPTVQAARRFLHTGTTVLKDEQRAAAIVAAAALGWSNRRIARELGHSQDTVRAVLRLAEAAGKVGAVKERVLASVAAAIQADIELGNEIAGQIRDAVDSGEGVKPEMLSGLAAFRKAGWVGAGILADKGNAAGPASITIVNQGDAVVNVVADYAKKLAQLGAADSASVGKARDCGELRGEAVIDVGSAVVGGAGGAGPDGGLAGERIEADAAGEGGGGGAVPPGV